MGELGRDADLLIFLFVCGRIESYGADYQFIGVFVHRAGGVVCGEEGYFSRYVYESFGLLVRL